MKLKSLLFVVSFGLFGNLFAANAHMHPKVDANSIKTVANKVTYPGYCQIEIVNNSFSDVFVYGTFDDGSTIDFGIHRYESPHYISLYYYSYCHNGMYLSIESPLGLVYSGWTGVDQSVYITPYLRSAAQAKVVAR